MTIWKYPLEMTDIQTIGVPRGAVPLSVQVQGETPCLWALVDPENPPRAMIVKTVGTGHACVLDGYRHLGTYQLHGGSLVFHVFVQGPFP